MATDLIRYLVSRLVDHPEALEVRGEKDGDVLRMYLSVHPDDRGRVIGSGGSTARSLRTIVRAAGTLQDRRIQLEIED